MRLLLLVPLLVASFGGRGTQLSSREAWRAKVDETVLAAAAQGETEFLIFLEKQADLSAAKYLPTKLEKGVHVYQRLAETALRTQKPILAWLDFRGFKYRSYWIANMIWARGDGNLVQEIAQRADVAHIYANPRVKLESPSLPELPDQAAAEPGLSTAIEWNILKVRAPDVWAKGYTGQGVVIGGQDTGFDWNHPAIKDKYRGWNGAIADHNYNWHDAIHENDPHTLPGNPCGFDGLEPCDDRGHGTHTMGIMVGDDGAGNQIGMAPGARWIGCRNMEQDWGTPASYSECYQWFIAPTDLNDQDPRPDLAPDVINNSWRCPPEEGCTDPNVLLTVVENVRAAGILTVHSAGNSGPSCSTVNTPAAIYEASFTVGNTDQNDIIVDNSSRGPVNIDGSNRLKPNVSAPGESIRSSVPEAFYGFLYYYMSGTSMAAPHVTGLAALLISAQPSLAGRVDEIETLIERSAVPRTTNQLCGLIPGNQIPNNTYGWGRIDAWSTLQGHALIVNKVSSPTLIDPGDVFSYTIRLTHAAWLTPTYNIVLTDVLPANTSFLTATLPHTLDDGTIQWDFAKLDPLESRSVELIVQSSPTVTETIVNQDYGGRSDEAPTTLGLPVFTYIISVRYYFPFISLKP